MPRAVRSLGDRVIVIGRPSCRSASRTALVWRSQWLVSQNTLSELRLHLSGQLRLQVRLDVRQDTSLASQSTSYRVWSKATRSAMTSAVCRKRQANKEVSVTDYGAREERGDRFTALE